MKYLSYEGLQYLYGKILTRLGLKVDAANGDISSTKISTFDTVLTEFPVPTAGENTKTVFGKIKKFITDFNSLKSSLLLLSMLTSQYENNTSKIPTAALVYALKQSLDATNSNLTYKYYESKFLLNLNAADKVGFIKYGNIKRFSIYALNEWYSGAGVEVKLCDLPVDVRPDSAFYKYMQYDSGKFGYVITHDNGLYLTPIDALAAGGKVTIQDIYF